MERKKQIENVTLEFNRLFLISEIAEALKTASYEQLASCYQMLNPD